MSTSTETRDDAGVHRLVDMVVEEVSLVDRAANKHRFLVVKRDAPMKDKTDPKTEDTTKPEDETPPGKKKPAKKADTADAIATATEILERLTAAVEMLGEASDDDADQILIELAGDLSEAAAEIAEAAGLAEDEEEGDATKNAGVGDTVAKVRALLDEVSKMLAAAKDTAKTDAPPAPPTTSAQQSDAVSQQLEKVVTSISTLTDAVKEQGQRVARLEKGTGLPNSRTHEERRPARDEDVGWPLDLNRPLDRESVDKATSFHDR
jgi:hypothetical protein